MLKLPIGKSRVYDIAHRMVVCTSMGCTVLSAAFITYFLCLAPMEIPNDLALGNEKLPELTDAVTSDKEGKNL